jgi:hypothetical protein
MSSLNLWELRQQLDAAKILICFNGPLSQSIIEQLGLAVKRYLEAETLDKGRLYDVFAVYIEQSQNIQNYNARKAAEGVPDHYLVTSGNPVARADLPALTQMLDALAKLDADQLKARFREQRRKPRSAGTSNAGLGLIDMARKSSQPLEYQVRNMDEHTAYFHLIAVI